MIVASLIAAYLAGYVLCLYPAVQWLDAHDRRTSHAKNHGMNVASVLTMAFFWPLALFFWGAWQISAFFWMREASDERQEVSK